MKKALLLLLILIIGTSILLSCGTEEEGGAKNREYDEKTVAAAAEELIKSSELLNELFWGEGIKYNPDPKYANGYYYMADYFSLDKFGVETVSDIENLTRGVFSEDFSNYIFSSTVFAPAYDADGNITLFARYSQKETDGVNEYIMVYSKWEPFLYDDVEYDYESIKVIRSEGEKVIVEISCTVTDSESKNTKEQTVSVKLIEESGGWRLDSPTYTSYIE